MREPANEGPSASTIGGGLLAVVVAIGAGLARVGDDLGRFVGTGAHLVDEVVIVGSMDDVGRVGDDLARLADDAVGGAVHGGDDMGLGLDLVGHGADAAELATDGLGLLGTREAPVLDARASSGPPVYTHARPSALPGPQLILVTPDLSPDVVMAQCAAAGRWCLVEQLGGEDRAAIGARFAELEQWWTREHPSDAAWVAALGARTPHGVAAAWLEPGDPPTVRHP